MPRIVVVLRLPRTDNGLIFAAKHIAECMDGNPYFPSPPVPIATLHAQVAAAQAAQAATLSRSRETRPARDSKIGDIRVNLDTLRVHVETVANQDAVHGEAIVASAGMYVKGRTGPRKPLVSVKQGPTSGTARVVARHPGGNVSFKWECSCDGQQPTRHAESNDASYLFEGLTPGLLYSFRFRVLKKGRLSSWSDAVTLWVE
jgi:hypothetical protein